MAGRRSLTVFLSPFLDRVSSQAQHPLIAAFATAYPPSQYISCVGRWLAMHLIGAVVSQADVPAVACASR
jgi:hypothetical protein